MKIVIPLFQNYNIKGVKYQDFLDWCKITEIMKIGGHRTEKGFEEISQIKQGMNKGRQGFDELNIEHTYSNSSGSASSEIMALPKISIYVYNKEGTVLYYIADNIRDLTDGLEIKESL